MMESPGLFVKYFLSDRRSRMKRHTAGLTSLNRTSNRSSNETSIKERLRSGACEGFGVRQDGEIHESLPSLKRAGKKPCLEQDGLLPRAREGFGVRKDEETHRACLP
jgi:hypothetical protein